MRLVLICCIFISTLASEPIALEWKWSGSGLYCNLAQIAEWIYCVRHEDSYALYVNSHNAYSRSEAVYPLLFKTNEEDRQIIFTPKEPFVPVFSVDGLPYYFFSQIPFKRFATDGMKNFGISLSVYACPNLFEDPDFPIFRNNLHPIIQKYMQPVPSLQERIDSLVEQMGQNEKIGIHVRCIPHYLGCAISPEQFLQEIEADIDRLMASKDRSCTVIYLATLLDPLEKMLSAKYNVIAIDIPRTQDVRYDWTDIPNADPLDMARDAIVDAWALSACDEFWCGSSNMSVFICCINPRLKTRLLPCLTRYKGA